MKILRIEYLIRKGPFSTSAEFEELLGEIKDSIQAVAWPPGSDSFVINPVKQANGVKPIKNGCMEHLYQQGWRHEKRMKITADVEPGPVDAVKTVSGGREFVLEWETGNISSSHRALNKVAVGLLERIIIGGALIVPSRDMYKWLTDRVGNYREIEPYFPVWKNLQIDEGVLLVVEVEHDGTSDQVPIIAKGIDGRAKKPKKKATKGSKNQKNKGRLNSAKEK